MGHKTSRLGLILEIKRKNKNGKTFKQVIICNLYRSLTLHTELSFQITHLIAAYKKVIIKGFIKIRDFKLKFLITVR